MKSNGNSSEPKPVTIHAEELIDAILDAEVSPPTKEQNYVQTKGRHLEPAYKFYQSIRWDEWWDEFATAIGSTGRLKYQTAWSFAKEKGKKVQKHKEWIYAMIGPKQENSNGIPWLGDWQKRRANCFWALDDPEKIKGIKQAFKERRDALDAALAIAPLSVQQIQRWLRLAEKIDDAFGGEPFLKELSANHPKNEARFKAYMMMHKAASAQLERASKMWLMAHGLNPSNTDQWAQMAILASGAAAGAAGMAAFAGARSGAAQPGITEGPSHSDILLAQSIKDKARLYGLPLPDGLVDGPKSKQ